MSRPDPLPNCRMLCYASSCPNTVICGPQHAQRQDSLRDQLRDLHVVATRLGMHDAADWLWRTADSAPNHYREPALDDDDTLITTECRERDTYRPIGRTEEP